MRPPPDRPPRAVVDSCVFGHLSQWISPLIDAARNGDVELIWSPTIIAETHRLLTWRWLQRHGGDLAPQSWRACSEDAKRFLQWVRVAFRIVDDRPPDEPFWTDRPRDEWDIPLWNAAIRSGADFIVTENLRDGPPPDAEGLRRHRGIVFVHPSEFLTLLEERVVHPSLPEPPQIDELPARPTQPDHPLADTSPTEIPPSMQPDIEAILALQPIMAG